MRQQTAAVKLCTEEWNVCLWGQNDTNDACGVRIFENMRDAVAGADALVLPLPASIDGATLNCPSKGTGESVLLSELADIVDADCRIIGGRLPESFVNQAELRGIKCFDYFAAEAFQIKNAYTTAEAALSIAMSNLKKTVRGADFAVTGYGRIAKQLAKILVDLGAKVTVCARKDSDLAYASLSGCRILKLDKEGKFLPELCKGYDIIFNTVPHWLFDGKTLKNMSEKTLIIELASAPGGIDVSAAKQLNSKILWASSLPGKYAPESAGELIAECVAKYLEGEVSDK